MKLPETITLYPRSLDVSMCASCGCSHELLHFEPYDDPEYIDTYYAMCPVTEESITKVIEDRMHPMLRKAYNSFGSTTTDHKMNILDVLLVDNIVPYGDPEKRLLMLEQEFIKRIESNTHCR